MHQSKVSTQRLPWTQGNNPFTNPGQTTNTSYPSNTCAKGLKKKYPPQLKKLAVHSEYSECLCKWKHRKGRSTKHQAMRYLEMIAFYYLFRVEEYTAPERRGRQLRTQLFLDVTFFKLRLTCGFLSPMPLNVSRKELLEAVAVILHIIEQKNSFKGAFVHHGALEGQIFACPVKKLAIRVAHIRVHTSD